MLGVRTIYITILNRNTPLPTTKSEDNLTLISKVLLCTTGSLHATKSSLPVPVAGVVLIMMRKCLIFLETNLVFSMLSGQATFLFLVENHLTARALAEANDQCSVLLSQVSRRKISKRCRYLSVAKSRVDLPLS